MMSALSQPTRWRAFQALLASGQAGLLQGEVAEKLGVSKNLLSVHLKVLQAAGLVTAERNGREVTYRATTEPLQSTIDLMQVAISS